MKNKKTLYSIILVAAILVIAGVLFLVMYLNKPTGPQVRVVVNGNEIFGVYNLSEDQKIVIVNGMDRNVLEIKDGKADMTESNCDNQICVHTPPIESGSVLPMPIVCLPHQVVVELVDTGE